MINTIRRFCGRDSIAPSTNVPTLLTLKNLLETVQQYVPFTLSIVVYTYGNSLEIKTRVIQQPFVIQIYRELEING